MVIWEPLFVYDLTDMSQGVREFMRNRVFTDATDDVLGGDSDVVVFETQEWAFVVGRETAVTTSAQESWVVCYEDFVHFFSFQNSLLGA